MSIQSGLKLRSSMRSLICVIGGILINICLFFVMQKLEMPIYLDTIGTIAVSYLLGSLPGIIVAVATDVLSVFFASNSLYFAIVNVAISLYLVWFIRRKSLKKIQNIIIFIIGAAVISALLSGAIQWIIFGAPQNETIKEAVEALSSSYNAPAIFVFALLNILINLLDKGITSVAAGLLVHLIPDDKRSSIMNRRWNQKPLSASQIKAIRKLSRNMGLYSIRSRISVMLFVTSIALVFMMGAIGLRLYNGNRKAELEENALSAVKFAASVLDVDMIDEYLEYGANADKVEGYTDTKDMLYKIRDNSPGVKYLYVLTIEEDGCHMVFDLDTDEVEGYLAGDIVEFEEAFEPYVPALLEGEQIPAIESDDFFGWLYTLYYPVKNDAGKTVCYVGADVSLQYMAEYMKDFIIRVILILSGFLVLIIAYGQWTSAFYFVYPINAVASIIGETKWKDIDQEELDEKARQLRALDIRTRDESQQLYKSLSEMVISMTEQLRDIRHYSEVNENMQSGLIITMADMVENRDSDTGAHIQKTAAYVKIIVEGLKKKGYYSTKITPQFMSDVVMSAPLHDVGKISIPDEVLNKPGKLTDEEFEIMKTHTSEGKRIMEKAIGTIEGGSYLKEARNMAAYHHERWDGCGYPEGLHGEVIPLSARIMAVADVFDALASPRVYKPAFPFEKAVQIIEEGAGTQFDPKCVEVFMDSLEEVKKVLKKYQDA